MTAEIHQHSPFSYPSVNGSSIVKNGKAIKRSFKIIVIGDSSVGKTCLTFRFCNGRFPGNTEATIGVDFRERVISIDGELIRVIKCFALYFLCFFLARCPLIAYNCHPFHL